MTDPLVTVLTAVRNGARYLPQTISSIRSQTVSDWEYVIVDDASEDDTTDMVEQAMVEDPRIRLLRRETRGGPYIAANEGLAVARGKYVARIDSDDIAPPNRLELQLGFLAEHPELRACGGFQRRISPIGELYSDVWHIPVRPAVLRWRLCLGAYPPHSSAFVEREAFEEIGGYAPLPLAQDWRLWCELSRRDWLGIVADVVVYRRVHGDRLTELEAPRQDEYGSEVAREHIRALGAEDWSLEEIRLLRRVARRQPAPLRDGLRIVDRWAGMWRRDSTLSPQERKELGEWTARVRRYQIRRWGESLPIAGPLMKLEGRASSVVRRAG
ncbi:MAG: glycosyltransferase family 2 protein, partial [Actinomycetota bacterium]